MARVKNRVMNVLSGHDPYRRVHAALPVRPGSDPRDIDHADPALSGTLPAVRPMTATHLTNSSVKTSV